METLHIVLIAILVVLVVLAAWQYMQKDNMEKTDQKDENLRMSPGTGPLL